MTYRLDLQTAVGLRARTEVSIRSWCIRVDHRGHMPPLRGSVDSLFEAREFVKSDSGHSSIAGRV